MSAFVVNAVVSSETLASELYQNEELLIETLTALKNECGEDREERRERLALIVANGFSGSPDQAELNDFLLDFAYYVHAQSGVN